MRRLAGASFCSLDELSRKVLRKGASCAFSVAGVALADMAVTELLAIVPSLVNSVCASAQNALPVAAVACGALLAAPMPVEAARPTTTSRALRVPLANRKRPPRVAERVGMIDTVVGCGVNRRVS